jgi:uncharacterized protein (DUF58 family)
MSALPQRTPLVQAAAAARDAIGVSLSGPARLVPSNISAVAVRRGRVGFGFGPRFFLLMMLGLVWLAPAWWDARFFYAMLAWDVFVFMVWFWDLLRVPRAERLNVSRVWTAPAAFETASHVTIVVRNAGAQAIYARVVDDTPLTFRAIPPEVEIRVAAREVGSATYPILPKERGDARFGRAYLRCQTVLQVAERWSLVELAQKVRVYPNLQQAQRAALYLIRSRQTQMERRLRRQRGRGREFESLREFRAGDEYREICWTASARRGHLVTKVNQVERSQTVWIVLDAGRLLRARIGGPSKLDYAVGAALSLAHVALLSGDNVGMLAYGRKVQQRVPPGKGTAHLRRLVESLAMVHVEWSEADHLRATDALLASQKRRSLVVWLTDLAETPATPEVIEGAMQVSHRHLVLFGVISQPELNALGRMVPDTVKEMYEHAAAIEMIHRRELLLSRLRQQGILALELPPGTLATTVVNRYLDIKERSLL